MKVRRSIVRNGPGHITVTPEDSEDMWHMYNLIEENDIVRASTVRKVTTESATGTTSSVRVHTTLSIVVESVEYDTHSGTLHIKGRNNEENDFVKMGAYHTLDLELNRQFTLRKECWDAMHLERVELACDPAQKADVAAIVMQEGLAHVCLVTPNMTMLRAKVEVTIPRKRHGNVEQHQKALSKFFDAVLQALVRHIRFDLVKCLLLASPGFVKDQFFAYIYDASNPSSAASVTSTARLLAENKSKFLLVHSSNGYKHALAEVLADPSVATRLADTKATADVRALDNFYATLASDADRAWYGVRHCERANDALAVDTLLISDALFRSRNLTERRRYVRLVESVREHGGVVRLFSSLHATGERLGMLGGVAAILRFPVPELDDEDEEEQAAAPAAQVNGAA